MSEGWSFLCPFSFIANASISTHVHVTCTGSEVTSPSVCLSVCLTERDREVHKSSVIIFREEATRDRVWVGLVACGRIENIVQWVYSVLWSQPWEGLVFGSGMGVWMASEVMVFYCL
jgi:hypothetical protein